MGEFGRCSDDVTCLLGVSIAANAKDSNLAQGVKVLKKFDQKSGRLEPFYWCNMIYTEPKKIINNVFSENEWYQTYQNGRNGDVNENVDCYTTKSDNKQTFYVFLTYFTYLSVYFDY